MVHGDDIRHERELREQWTDGHRTVHELEQKALKIALGVLDERLEEMNKLRAQIESERGSYTTRELHDKLEKEVDGRLKLIETFAANWQGRFWMMGAAVSAVVVAVNVLLGWIYKR